MTGTQSQIEWAEQIRPRVAGEFDRVEKAFADAAARQSEGARADTLAIIAILKEKRDEALAHDFAGYYIREWQELTDQVRQSVFADQRYQAIKQKRNQT